MAKAKKQVSFEDALWSACDKLRGTVEPAEYKHGVPYQKHFMLCNQFFHLMILCNTETECEPN